jgi:hypothetical protein
MKIFINKIILFIGISVLFISVLILSTHRVIKYKSNFALKAPVKNVIFGHSHPTYAFNDSLISDFKNLAQSRQSYFYSFIKARNVLSQNNSIKAVFIEFTNNQISKEMDDWIWDDYAVSSRFPSYLPFMNKDEIKLLYKNNSKAFFAGVSKSFRENIINILSLKYDYKNKIGGYKWLERNRTDSILASGSASHNPNTPKKSYNQLSLKNIEFLEKIVNYCIDKNIKVYLIRSPQHKKYKGRLNEDVFIKIRKERFKTIEFLDFNNFPLENCEFADLDHLNYKGATKFSKWFNEMIKKGLLTIEDKQEFIDSELEKYKYKINDLKT